jgi:hypothetical protein
MNVPQRVRRAWWDVRWHTRSWAARLRGQPPLPAAEDDRAGRLEALDAGIVRQLDEYRG